MKRNKAMLSTIIIGVASQAAISADNTHHLPGVFLGATHVEGETEFTYGVEYEYKFGSKWGLGAVYEKTEEAHHGDGVTVKLGSIFYHPGNNIRLGFGAGRERVDGDHPHSETLYRTSFSYDFHFGRFGIAPTLAVDFVDDDEAVVFGVAIIRPF